MNLFEFLVLVLATFALSVAVFFLFRVLFPPPIVVSIESSPPARWWPWSLTSYNHWPYWMGGGGSVSSGGGTSSTSDRLHHRPRPHHGDDHARPWGGTQRGANGGAPSAPSAPPAPSAPSK